MAGPEGHTGGGTSEQELYDPGDRGVIPGQVEVSLVRDFRANLLAEGRLVVNPSHDTLFAAVDPSVPEQYERWGVVITNTGAWAEVNPDGERSRNPKQTFFVCDGERGGPQGEKIYWDDTVGFQPLERSIFTALLTDSLDRLGERTVYQTERQVGAIADFAFPVDTYTDSPTGSAFSNNMFPDREVEPTDSRPALTVITLPHDSDKINPVEWGLGDRLGKERTGLIITDPETGIILVRGFAYHGPIKKSPFTLMNHLLPDMGVFPAHASASEGPNGDVSWHLGLSGTGKSTIGNLFEERRLVGDDELLLTPGPNARTANMENGVYPIVLGIKPETEPALYSAAFTPRPPAENRSIFQNTVVEDGEVQVDDDSLTANTRVSVPMKYIPGSKESGQAGPPDNIFFITKDVAGVMPPIARLAARQAMFWFLMGPTSTTAAEVNSEPKPVPTFSRFFGSPFMSRHPSVYMKMLEEVIDTYDPGVWLVNTGFTGGSEGAGGTRIGIPETKAMVGAALNGELDDVEFREDERFKIMVPTVIPGSEAATALLNPADTWQDRAEYELKADSFAELFLNYFRKMYSGDPKLAEFAEFSPAPLGRN